MHVYVRVASKCECFACGGKEGREVIEIASARVQLRLLAAANIFIELENSFDNRENETSRALANLVRPQQHLEMQHRKTRSRSDIISVN